VETFLIVKSSAVSLMRKSSFEFSRNCFVSVYAGMLSARLPDGQEVEALGGDSTQNRRVRHPDGHFLKIIFLSR
jgi:hypothetical protein